MDLGRLATYTAELCIFNNRSYYGQCSVTVPKYSHFGDGTLSVGAFFNLKGLENER